MLRRWLVTTPLAALIFLAYYIEVCLSPAKALHTVVAKWSARLLAASAINITARGKVTGPGPFVIVSNHQSLLDTPVLLAYLGHEFRFIAKQSLFSVPIIGAQLRRGGHIAVVREDARGAMESLAAAQKVLEQGTSVLVFAEGTRSAEGLGEFKTGAAHLAIQAGVPVLPVGLTGTAGLLPRGTFTIHPGRVRLAIGEPIPVAGLTRRDREGLTARIRTDVASLLGMS